MLVVDVEAGLVGRCALGWLPQAPSRAIAGGSDRGGHATPTMRASHLSSIPLASPNDA